MLIKYETFFWENGITHIAGVDEVGRGALAGPLVSAAVILPKAHLYRNNDVSSELLELYSQINDSKLVTAKRREVLAKFIKEHAVAYAITQVDNRQVDTLGITGATQQTFFEAIQTLKIKPEHILTDTFAIKKLTPHTQTNIPKGDTLSISIAAASIIAKVYRDALMVDLHTKYTNYGFDQHKGYGTKLHMEILANYGPCELHRVSFAPVARLLAK